MTIERKVGMGIAGQPSGGATDVADVFSTYLYTGNGSTQTINNGIDLAGEGGMVWIKDRDGSNHHSLTDTVRGNTKWLGANENYAESTFTNGITSFNSDGFSLGANGNYNIASNDIVSWTFRKAPKFFDVVTYSGNSVAGRALSHNLGAAPAMVMIKCTSSGGDWLVWHKNGGGGGGVTTTTFHLNTTAAGVGTNYIFYGGTGALTDTTFGGLGPYDYSNESGKTYVAYLFADNTAEDADDQMIKCGSVTGNSSATQDINLGWEAQYVLYKSTSSGGWYIWDSMRGLLGGANNGDGHPIYANAASAEFNNDDAGLLPTGFQVADAFNTNGATYIYMAIRAPMMKEPESGAEVFNTVARTGTGSAIDVPCGFVTDTTLITSRNKIGTGNVDVFDRLRGANKLVATNLTSAEVSDTTTVTNFDLMSGVTLGTGANGRVNYTYSSTFVNYFFKRAKGFMDCVAYSGTGTPLTLNHSLSVAPELIMYKSRSASQIWFAQSSALTSVTESYVFPNTDSAEGSAVGTIWRTPDVTTFGIDYTGNLTGCNTSGVTYIAYLFATLAGVSKVGSYTGNGSSQTINCGFAAGARFILIKRTDATGDWYIWDTTRGIVAGNDPHLSLNTASAEVSDDSIDPANSGFSVNQISATNINVSSGTYIYLAIAQDYQL